MAMALAMAMAMAMAMELAMAMALAPQIALGGVNDGSRFDMLVASFPHK